MRAVLYIAVEPKSKNRALIDEEIDAMAAKVADVISVTSGR